MRLDLAMGCGGAPKCGQDYLSSISGPLFDGIDLRVEVPTVQAADLSLPPPREDSGLGQRLPRGALLGKVVRPDAGGRTLLGDAAARTPADLDGSEGAPRLHVAEALGYWRLALGRQALYVASRNGGITPGS
jgi:magnesium chelatase family protein